MHRTFFFKKDNFFSILYRLSFFLIIYLLFSSKAFSQQAAGTQVGYPYSPSGKITGYLVYLPKDYYDNPTKKFPLLVFFHGAGERGENLALVRKHGPPKMVDQGRDFPFIMIAPQARYTWDKNTDAMDELIESVKKDYRIDENRFYVTGLSMGGAGTWNYAVEYGHKIAAIVPICGWGQPQKACNIKDVPVWATHNEKDPTVGVGGTLNMVNALKNCPANPMPIQIIYPGGGHDAWTRTYNDESMWQWLLSQSKNGIEPPVNQAPIANAGEDKQLTLPNNSVTLVGSGVDKDGSISKYQWSKTTGPGVTMTDTDKASLKLTNLVAGVYTFKLTVTDNRNATASDEIKVTVNPEPQPENQAPIANAGSDKTLTLPENNIVLIGSGEDKDGEITSYLWAKVSGPEATLVDTDKPSLILKDLIEGTYTFRLIVTDNDGATDSDEVKVTVNPEPQPENQAPIANAGSDKTLTLPENNVILNGSGEDKDGEITAYLWTKVSGPEATMANADKSDLSLKNLVEGTYTFRLTVTDNDGATASDEVKVTVKPASQPENQTPIANAGSDKTLALPENNVVLNGSGEDKDGEITAYLWTKVSGPEVTMADSDKSDLILDDLVAGIYTFRLTVTDNEGANASDEVKVTVKQGQEAPANQAPTANAGGDKTLTLPENAITLKGLGEDEDGEIASYLWTKISGPEATMTDTEQSDLILKDLVEGIYTFKLTVTDNEGAMASDEVQILVNPSPKPENQAPVANAGGDRTLILPKDTITLTGSGEDKDGDITAYIWTKASGPEVTMTDTDKPALKLSDLQAGTYIFRLSVTDNEGATSSDEAKVIVRLAPNQVPTVSAGNDRNLTLPNSSTTLEGSASDADGAIVSYLWTKVSGPQAKMVDTDKATLSISNLVEGSYAFTLTVTDNRGVTASDEVKVTVKPAPNQSPTANAGKDVMVTLPNNAIKLTGSGTDNDGQITGYQWSKISGPAASIADAYTPILSLTNLVAGVYTFRLTVTDNRGAKASDEVKVTVNTPPLANAGRDKTLTLPENSTYISGAGSDTDGTIVAYSWTKKSGPSVVMKNADTYLLLLSELKEGTYVFTLEVTDNRGAKAWDDMKLTVLPAPNLPPTVNAGRDKKIQLPSNSLQLVGNASDSDGEIVSYLWTKINGPTAAMTGVNSPTLQLSDLSEGSYTFRLTVRDDDGATASDEVRVIVERIIFEMTLEFATTDNRCFGASEGSAQANILGGEMPYTFYWSNGEATETIANLAAGSYTLTVTDKAGRSVKGTVNITQPDELRVTAEIANETNRGNDGRINVNVSGGTAPYTYEWSNGAIDADNDNLSKAEYTLLVRDANGCSVEQTYQVDKNKEYNTTVYPNPSNGLFNIGLDNVEAENYEIRVFDSQGMLVMEENDHITLARQVKTLDLSNKGKGIYFIKIIYDGKYEETKRVIIN